MKRIAFTLSILAAMLLACSISGTVTPPVDKPAVVTNPSVITEVPALGSTRVSEIDGMTLIFVPGGEFPMGSNASLGPEKPVHTVHLDPYWIDRTEVTNDMFGLFVSQSGYQTYAEKAGVSEIMNLATSKMETIPGADWQHPQGPASDLSELGDHPVVQVSWYDALAYCQWAGRRLPTEAEWEKAARGMDARDFPWGDDFDGTLLNFADASLNAFWGDNDFDDGYQFTAPVGSYPMGASPYDILDMAGNAWEWANDWADESYYQDSPASNPGGPPSGDNRIVRGGSWHDIADGQLAAYRGWATPDTTSSTLGIRCALSE